MADILSILLLWTKSLHIISVIAWMAGLFYLPRLFVYHVERFTPENDEMFQMMEQKLLKVIMRPAMISTWLFGLMLVFTPGIVDWTLIWPWTKAAAVLGMTWFHHWLLARFRCFQRGENTLSGRQFRMMNEVPTVFLIVIVFSVVLKF